MTENHYDVIIIGTGAAAARSRASLPLPGRRSSSWSAATMLPREKDNWSTRAVNVQGKYQTKEVWSDRDGKPLHPHTNYCVGGNTKFYGAALFRLRREDFCTVKHHGGVSPGWPVTYDELDLTIRWPNSTITCTASAARIPPIRRRRGRIPTPL